jgi:hypothetical protein
MAEGNTESDIEGNNIGVSEWFVVT